MALTKITTSVIAANTLSTANIADNSIDATKIASNSILTRHIDDDQITGDQLADTISIVTDLNVGNNLTVTGNLTVNGSTVTNSSTNTTIEDALIELGTGTSGSPSTDAGIVIERGSSDNVFIGWDESADKVTVGTGSFTGASSGNLTITPAAFVSGALTASGLAYPTSDGSSGQVIQTDGSGNLSFGNKASSSQVDTYATSGDGSTTAFDTGTNPLDEKNTWVFIDGVYQQKSTYSYSGSTITFGTAPDNGAAIDVITGTTDSMSSSDTVLGVYEATTTATATYSTGLSASNENNTWVFVGGVLQPKDSYTFSSGTLTFDAATPAGEKLSVTATRALTAGSVVTASMGANAVTSAKIASNSILSRHIANNSIVGADISATTGITAATFTGALTGNVTGNVTGNITGNVLTAAQTNITSVGTLSALTVSGDLTVDTSTLKVDSTNNRVGIGKTTPSGWLLDVDSADQYVASFDGSNNTGVAINSESGYSSIIGYSNSASSYNKVNIRAATGVGLVVDTSNRVGIGTTSPSYLLHVTAADGTEANNYVASFVNAEATDGQSFGVTINAGSNATDIPLNITTHDGGTVLGRLKGDGTFLIPSGNVGIGTSSPASSAGWTPTLVLDDTSAALIVKGVNSQENSIGSSNGLYIDSLGSSTGTNNRIIFRTTNTNSHFSGTERMRITSAGYVGIGTSSPAEALHVNGNFLLNDADPRIFLQTGSTHYNWKISAQDAVDGGLEISSGGSTDADATNDTYTQRLVIKRDGYVGVHTTSPTVPFHVINNFTGAVTRLDQTGTGGGNHGLEVRCASTTSWATQIRNGSGSGTLQFGVTGDNVYAHHLGVGTSSPNNPLHVSTSTANEYPYRHQNGTGSYYMGHGNSSYHHHEQSGGSVGFYWGSACYANGGFSTYSDERLKENITTIDSALDKVALMNGVTFNWKDTELRGEGKQFGVTAQNMLEVDSELPDLVEDATATQEEIDNEELNTQYYSMDYARLTPFFIEAIKELKTQNEALKARVETLENN